MQYKIAVTLLHWIDPATRFRLAWLTPQEQGAKVRNSALVAEFMYKW